MLRDCRPAAKDALDSEAAMIGIPAHVHSGDSRSGSRFFVVEMTEPPAPSAAGADGSQDAAR